MDAHIGHPSQCSGVEELRLVGGKGDGMQLYEVRNGKGLSFIISPQRGMDISRLHFRGMNCAYLSPSGYVVPAYFSEKGTDFLKSFTCGFLTTCGLRQVGVPCEDGGEQLSLHGTISNLPAINSYYIQREKSIEVYGTVRDEVIFGDKLKLDRRICCSLEENTVEICDCITNEGDKETPLMVMYHFNIGYPLLSEVAELYIASKRCIPRDKEAEKGLGKWAEITTPQKQFAEQCFYHKLEKTGRAGIFNPEISIGFMMYYDTQQLTEFTQWKMMGVRDYVMGLEPGNCNPEGRSEWRKKGRLEYLKPEENKEICMRICFYEDYSLWKSIQEEEREEIM